MTTQQPLIFVRSGVPLPESAPFPGIVAMNHSVTFQRIAAGIDGWAELVDAHQRAAGIFESGPPRVDRPETPEDAARAILAGEDPSTVIDGIGASADAARRRELFARVADAARREVSDRAEEWVATHLAEIEDALTADVNSIFKRAAEAVAHLDGVNLATDLVSHPLAATHWATLARLGIELAEIERNAEALRTKPLDGAPERNWPLVGVLDDYPKAWTRFFLTAPLETNAGTLGPERAPWDDLDWTVVLRRLAPLNPVARIRLGRHYREHLDDLAKRAASDRAKLEDTIREEARRERGLTDDRAPWAPAEIPWTR